jgi:hypothetical protein
LLSSDTQLPFRHVWHPEQESQQAELAMQRVPPQDLGLSPGQPQPPPVPTWSPEQQRPLRQLPLRHWAASQQIWLAPPQAVQAPLRHRPLPSLQGPSLGAVPSTQTAAPVLHEITPCRHGLGLPVQAPPAVQVLTQAVPSQCWAGGQQRPLEQAPPGHALAAQHGWPVAPQGVQLPAWRMVLSGQVMQAPPVHSAGQAAPSAAQRPVSPHSSGCKPPVPAHRRMPGLQSPVHSPLPVQTKSHPSPGTQVPPGLQVSGVWLAPQCLSPGWQVPVQLPAEQTDAQVSFMVQLPLTPHCSTIWPAQRVSPARQLGPSPPGMAGASGPPVVPPVLGAELDPALPPVPPPRPALPPPPVPARAGSVWPPSGGVLRNSWQPATTAAAAATTSQRAGSFADCRGRWESIRRLTPWGGRTAEQGDV